MAENDNTSPVVPTPVPDTTDSVPVAVTQADVVSDETPVVNTAEATTVETADSPDEPETPKGKNRAEERIQDLVAERNAAKEYAEYWREAAMKGIRTPQEQQTRKDPEPVVADEPPTLEQFAYDQSKWVKAHNEWTSAQVKLQVAATLAQERSASANQEAITRYEEKVEVFKKDHPDFDTVMANPRLPALDHIAAAMIVSSDLSADITYALAKNPDLATRISRMSPPQQALAIGRLEQEVKQPVVKKEPPVVRTAPAVTQTTKAPAPPQPVPAGGVAEPSPATMSVKEWMQMRSGETKVRRRGGRVA